MKKNILLVSLAVIFSMSMVACGKEQPQEAALTAETETQLVIQVDTEEPKELCKNKFTVLAIYGIMAIRRYDHGRTNSYYAAIT